MTGLFKWGGRKAGGAVEEPVRQPSSASGHLASSKVLPRFLSMLGQRTSPVILDLGPVVGANVEFFGDRLSCKIFVEDLFADVEHHARRGDAPALAAFFAARLQQPDDSIDGILCWDLFDYLDRSAGQALARRLKALLRPDGLLYGFFGTTPVDLCAYTRFAVEGENQFRQRSYPATTTRRQVLQNRDIGKMFDGLTVVESVLLKSSTRETLFRKRPA